MRLSYRLNIGQNHKIFLDAAQNAVFLHLYNAGNIGSFVLKTFTMRPMRCDAALFLLYDSNCFMGNPFKELPYASSNIL